MLTYERFEEEGMPNFGGILKDNKLVGKILWDLQIITEPVNNKHINSVSV